MIIKCLELLKALYTQKKVVIFQFSIEMCNWLSQNVPKKPSKLKLGIIFVTREQQTYFEAFFAYYSLISVKNVLNHLVFFLKLWKKLWKKTLKWNYYTLNQRQLFYLFEIFLEILLNDFKRKNEHEAFFLVKSKRWPRRFVSFL